MSSSGYIMGPPDVQSRWDAGKMATTQKGVGAALSTLATLIYALRMYTRVHLTNRSLSMDDYLSGVLVVCCWVFYGCTWTISVNIFYMLSSDLAKISLLFFYLRLCPERNYRILVNTLVVCFVLYAIICAFISILATGKCVDKFGFFLAASVANVVMDLVILLLPLRIVIPLQIPRRQKISLLLLFATGSFVNNKSVIIVAIYNCILTVKLFNSANYTWGLAYELSWMYAELTGCPFFVRFIPALFSSRVGGYSVNSPGDITKGSSFGVRSRRQLSRKQTDAIELESGDESESARKVRDDDEARLWSDPGPTASRKSHGAHSKIRGPTCSGTSVYPPPVDTGITIVSTTEVLHDRARREGHGRQ
ncbi:hypothetical protein EDB81DRAFT_847412 [Dactylonectria macrodidyma]|uniref:Rhodopsin domain-containing protein n=1 Tax=Dactylonectria macrodidyma TaxID=307937 RepID=A0A9P9DQB8_9HYPO|nr:hypothetical protein EDB81DRAFT_847412 [Dactylonectria macrodidyma]